MGLGPTEILENLSLTIGDYRFRKELSIILKMCKIQRNIDKKEWRPTY